MHFTTASTRGHHANWTRTSLALALALALCGTGALNASAANAAAANAFATLAQPTALHGGDAVIGALPMNQPIHVEVALKLRNKDALDALIEANTQKQMHRHAPDLLTSERFLASHAPTATQSQSVADYLKSKGYTNVTIAPNRLLVSADGTAQTARDAFMTRFAQVRTHDGRIAFANTDEVRIPVALGDRVLAVLGLQNVHVATTDATLVHTQGQSTFVTTHDPMDFWQIYRSNGNVSPDIPVGIVSSGSLHPAAGLNQALSDLDTFTSTHGIANVATDVVTTNGAPTSSAVDQNADLASQVILGMSRGYLQKFIFYNIPDTSEASLTADFNKIVSLNETKIIEDSYGICETDAQADGSAAAQDAILEVAAAQGQTFAVSTGSPNGADQCNNHTNTPRWPSSSQYVVAVGGTLLNASSTTWGHEQVYNASGGAPSTFEPMPAWQSTFGVPGSTRVAIDVAFDANPDSGAKIVVNNAITAIGTNALAASLFAGAWAQVLQEDGNTFGFAGPALYAIPAADFHDIATGNNSGGRAGVGFTATTGYDFASGRGSMIVSQAIFDSSYLRNKPPVANFSEGVAYPTVYFRDKSTDSDGTISKHAWDFGDGSTSTTANPRHDYPVAKSYVVSETVADNDGATSNSTQTLFIGPHQLMLNPGFEDGRAHWIGNANFTINDPTHSFDGTGYAAVAHNYGGFSQALTIPATHQSATLSFYLWVADYAPSTTATDGLSVAVYDETTGTTTVLATFSNLDGSNGCGSSGVYCPPNYVLHTVDVTPFIGHPVAFQFDFRSLGTPTLNTGFFLDDITLPVQ